MEEYWIRNRGRVQGPFNIDRIQGLMRRGRFNRHFHVSLDKKNWSPAADFPELFDGVGRSKGGGEQEDVFQSGGSPFDDDYDAAPARSKGRPAPTQSAFGNDDDDDEEWEEDDEDWEDDDDDYTDGALSGLVRWVEANTKILVVVLVLILGVVGWFVFSKEGFTQDKEDLDQLIALHSRITMAHSAGQGANEWTQLADATEAELAPLIARLNETANARDHIKQELLFAARDDIPRIFKELPQGTDDAQKRILLRFSKIDRMITDQTRQDDNALVPSFAAPVQKNKPQNSAVQGEISDGSSKDSGEQPSANESLPPGIPQSRASERAPATQPKNSSGEPMMEPGVPPSSGDNGVTPSIAPAGGVPGRPQPGNQR